MTLVQAGPYEPPIGNPLWLQGFFVDVHPTTCDEYEQFAQTTGRAVPTPWPGGGTPARVRWPDAHLYSAWACKQLPTKQQLQRAASGDEGVVLAEAGAERCTMSGRVTAPGGCATFRTGPRRVALLGNEMPSRRVRRDGDAADQ